MRHVRLLSVMVLLVSPLFSQTSSPEPQTQQQIHEELRAIRRDLRATTTLQLLLSELQIAQATFDHAVQRRDSVKADLLQLRIGKTAAQKEVTRYEAGMAKVVNPEQEFVDQFEELKETLRKMTVKESGVNEQLQEAERRLSAAEAERDSVQGQLRDLVKRLGAFN